MKNCYYVKMEKQNQTIFARIKRKGWDAVYLNIFILKEQTACQAGWSKRLFFQEKSRELAGKCHPADAEISKVGTLDNCVLAAAVGYSLKSRGTGSVLVIYKNSYVEAKLL